ncbi:hypothetical protein KO516_21485 [Citreicella sp. C3M06]|uniref:hypothetical protein n=1 Tax=Citreicella sp. C3M06 TaxID=2841564 RepID=UPI001C08A1E9|nr:hypothetical protein [Citreicella sp. C3M06]MBU2963349.1 hypothetical protein [Citreicella sp. C3M06]
MKNTREDFLDAATCLALHRGGMRICVDRITALADAYAACSEDSGLGELRKVAFRVLSATDEVAFGDAREALWSVMSRYYADRVLRPAGARR